MPHSGQRLRTEQGEMWFLGMITNCRRLGTSWAGKLPDGREVIVGGKLPERGTLVAIRTGEEHTTGIYQVRRCAETRPNYVPPDPQRDAEIYAKRKAGQTLKAIGAEYGLSVESIRRIECQQWRREQNPSDKGFEGLSTRSGNVLKYLNFDDEDPKVLAKRIAEAGRSAFVGKPNCGKKTIAELEAWLNKHGYHWGPEIDLDPSEYVSK